MATHVAIDPQKKVHEMSGKTLETLKTLHRNGKIEGWQYGTKAEVETLKAAIITPEEAKNAIDENKDLKAQLEKANQLLEEAKASKQTLTPPSPETNATAEIKTVQKGKK